MAAFPKSGVWWLRTGKSCFNLCFCNLGRDRGMFYCIDKGSWKTPVFFLLQMKYMLIEAIWKVQKSVNKKIKISCGITITVDILMHFFARSYTSRGSWQQCVLLWNVCGNCLEVLWEFRLWSRRCRGRPGSQLSEIQAMPFLLVWNPHPCGRGWELRRPSTCCLPPATAPRSRSTALSEPQCSYL